MARATRGCPLDSFFTPREAAKEALYRRNLVESEVSSLGGIESQASKCGRVPHPDPGHFSPSSCSAPPVRGKGTGGPLGWSGPVAPILPQPRTRQADNQ